MRRIVMFVLISAAMLATAAVASVGASPRAVRKSIVAAALAQRSVHWTWSLANLWSSKRTADVSADSAIEHVTLYGPGAKVTILRVGETEYARGNAEGLYYEFGLTDAQASQYAGQWIAIPKGDTSYETDGLTLASVVHDAIPRRRVKVFLRRSNASRLFVLHGTSAKPYSFPSTLSAHARSKLPVAYGGGAVDVWVSGRFSRWNEPVDVQAPSSSIPIATVRGS